MEKFKILTILMLSLTLICTASNAQDDSASIDQNLTNQASMLQIDPENKPLSEAQDASSSQTLNEAKNDIEDKQDTSDFWTQEEKDRPSYTRSLLTSILFLAVLGWAGMFISKKLMPHSMAGSSKNIRVCETVRLGAGRNLHIVQVRGLGKVLIGSTGSSISMISTIENGTGDNNID